MKKITLIALPVILFLASCGNSKTEDAVVIPGMQETKISINGNNLTLMVPDSSKGRMEITEQSWGATEIKVGEDFNISIAEEEGDVALTKSDIAGDDVFKLQKYITDEPTMIFWEAKNPNMDDSRFHFYAIIKSGTLSYVVKDVESGEAYSQKAIEKMIESAKTIKVKEAEKPNS